MASGFIFAAVKIHENTMERQMTNIISLYDRHRSLWSELIERPELRSILQPNGGSLTPQEEFLNLVIIHYELGWRMAQRIGPDEVDAQKRDARKFFSSPPLRAVWEKTKGEKNLRFVSFIDRAIERRD